MRIIFDKTLKQKIFQMLDKKVKDKTCPFCGKNITAKNFSGAIFYEGEFRFINNFIVCLIQVADLQEKEK